MSFDRFTLARIRADRGLLDSVLTEAGAKINGSSSIRCPFHSDSQASGSVHEKEGSWRYTCHACGVGGDALDLLQRVRGIGFADAVVKLTGRNGNGHGRKSTPAPKSTPSTFPTAEKAIASLEQRHGPLAKRWDYHNAEGEHVGSVLRWDRPDDKKDIRPLARTPSGWIVGAMPTPRPLHNLPALLAQPTATVHVVEGEKCVDALTSVGLLSTTSAGGAKAAHSTDWGPLAGRDCVLLPDNDAPGEEYIRDVAGLLGELGARVRVLRLPGLASGEDVVEFVASRDSRTADEIRLEIEALADAAPEEVNPFRPMTARELLKRYPRLREPTIDGIAREGELVNVIAPPKTGKSWLALDLALAVATGRKWLGHATRAGRVLLLDNELHPETLAHRVPKVAEARSIPANDYLDVLDVQTVRGQNIDLLSLDQCFSGVAPSMYRIVVLDALYRFWPRDCDENDNAGITRAYNALDVLAERLRCVFVLIHHATKGSQSSKSVVDVGAGAGALARATDAHVVLRAHEAPGAVVMDGAVRSWPPLAPRCLRWAFPVWLDAVDLDPADLKPERSRKKPKPDAKAPVPRREWTAEVFAQQFLTPVPAPAGTVIETAVSAGLSAARAKRLLEGAEHAGLIHRHRAGPRDAVKFSSCPPGDSTP